MYKIFSSFCGHFAFALGGGNTVLGWGLNSKGQVGIGTLENAIVPSVVDFDNDDEIENIALGLFHSVFISSTGTVYVAGSNFEGQIAMKKPVLVTKPSHIPDLPAELRFKSASCGASHTLLLSTEGVVYSFGRNSEGQLGVTPGQGQSFSIVHIRGTGGNEMATRMISCGGNHSICVTDEGIYGFGSNLFSKLGITGTIAAEPVKLDFMDGIRVIDVKCGWNHTVFLTETGYAICLGRFGSSRPLHPDERSFAPLLIGLSSIDIVAIGCGDSYAIFKSGDGNISFIGSCIEMTGTLRAEQGIIGLKRKKNDVVLRSLIYQDVQGDPIVDFSCGNSCIFLVTQRGFLYALGSNIHGQLGLGNLLRVSSPLRVPFIGRQGLRPVDSAHLPNMDTLADDLCNEIIKTQK